MKQKRIKLATVVWALPVILLLLLLLVSVFSQMAVYTRTFKRRSDEMRSAYLARQKLLIKQEVDRVIDNINYQRSLSDQRTQEIIRQQTYEAYAVADSIFRQHRSDKSDNEIRQLVLAALRSMRFAGGSGYFFAIRLDGLVTLNANKPDLEGHNLLALKDCHGFHFIREMIETVRRSGEGFCEYYWDKPGAVGCNFKKISFVRFFKPFNWLIGTGLYVDDIENRTKSQMLTQLNQIKFGENGYLFAGGWDGVSLAHGTQPDLIGKNMWEYVDSKGSKTTQLLIAASKKPAGGYVSYWWRRPSTGKESPKLAYARGVPAWKLFVATGVYLDDIEDHIAGLRTTLKRELRHRLEITLLFVTAVIIFFLIVLYFVNHRLQHDLDLFIAFFRQAVRSDKKIERSKIRFEEFYQIAGDANAMLKGKIAVQKELQELAVIAEQAAEGIIVADFDHRLRFVNQAWADMHGYRTGKELLGRPLEIFHTWEQLEKEVYPFNEEVRQHGRKSGEVGHQRRDSTLFLTWMNATMLRDADDKPYAFLAFAEDISERKKIRAALAESERRYQTLFESANYAIFLMKDGVFTDCNHKTLVMFRAERDEIVGQAPGDFSPLFQPDGRPSAEKAAEKINIVLKGKPQTFEWLHQKLDGTEFDAEVNLNRVELAAGPHVLALVQDITWRKQAEEEMLKLRKLESVGVLAGGIAHDFNNLLTGIFGNIEMARMFLSSEHQASKFLELAGQSMESATGLTKQLLTFAKGGEPVKEVLLIAQFIVETARFSLRGSNVDLKLDIAPDLLPVEADKGQLGQVFTNLVINAQQSMPTGGTITLTAENVDLSGARFVKLCIQDEGVGIASQYLDRVFDPYFSTKQHGSGLGLASVHSIITKHGGTIKVDSILDQGTTFTIHLPAAAGNVEDCAINEDAPVASAATESALRVLVMDDEEIIREVVGAMLETLGHKISYAVHGQEAIEKYQQTRRDGFPYAVVIMDLTIPGGMGGQAAAAEILKLDPDATLIVSSGYSTDPVMARYKDYGFSGRIVKPFHFTELQAVIQQVLKN